MRAFEFLIEYGKPGWSRSRSKYAKYGLEGKPEWFDRAVQMKLNNPRISAAEISRQIGLADHHTVLYWLTGKWPSNMKKTHVMPDRPHTKDWPPFKQEDFPNIGNRQYFDGAKPEWYDQALQMAKAGESFTSIGKKIGVSGRTIGDWLVKGRKNRSGKWAKLVNPDAEINPRKIRGQKLDPQIQADVENLIKDPDLSDADIIELIADEKGDKIASQVRAMLPQLRQALQPGTEVRNKVTGDDITGFVQ